MRKEAMEKQLEEPKVDIKALRLVYKLLERILTANNSNSRDSRGKNAVHDKNG